MRFFGGLSRPVNAVNKFSGLSFMASICRVYKFFVLSLAEISDCYESYTVRKI